MAKQELAEFLVYSIELESEAHDRYQELADAMVAHNNQPVADFFQRMAQEASQHLREVEALSVGLELPDLKAWDFIWPEEEAPETASYEALHYRMSLRQAIVLALQNEQAAERYYRQRAREAVDSETAKLAAQFADEELSHAAELRRMMAALPEDRIHHLLEDDDPHMPE